MERDELRTTLVNHLETLRRNLQVVSMEVLKTKYKKPFDALRQDICKAATASIPAFWYLTVCGSNTNTLMRLYPISIQL